MKKEPEKTSRSKKVSATRRQSSQTTVAEFDEVVALIEAARREAGRAVNVQLIELYWKIGAVISRRIESDGWGKGTVTKLSAYLSRTQRGTRGFSPQNLWRMRQFFEAHRDTPELSTLVRELPWSANLHILSAAKSPEEREFYLRMAVEKHWNVRELARQIRASTFERSVLGPPKLSTALREIHPQAANDFKDVYSLEFVDLADGHSEADLHGALLRNLGRFITELGRDFCFVGSEYPVQVGKQDFAIDLLLFHRGLTCLVAFELLCGRPHKSSSVASAKMWRPATVVRRRSWGQPLRKGLSHISRNYSVRKKAIKSGFSRQGGFGSPPLISQAARAFAFISRSASA